MDGEEAVIRCSHYKCHRPVVMATMQGLDIPFRSLQDEPCMDGDVGKMRLTMEAIRRSP